MAQTTLPGRSQLNLMQIRSPLLNTRRLSTFEHAAPIDAAEQASLDDAQREHIPDWVTNHKRGESIFLTG
eukprot:1195662-Prorocentrum_minimum.AAC.2